MTEEVKKYPDGTEIKQFPKWVYPGGKPVHASPANRTQHNGVLVNNEKELQAVLESFGEVEKIEPNKSEISKAKENSWKK